jgi:hypothetical protein
MRSTRIFLQRLTFAAALAVVLPATGSDPTIHAEVKRALATPYSVDDPDVAGFKLKFDTRLADLSTKLLDIPGFAKDDGAVGVDVLGVQSKQPDETWRSVIQSLFVDAGNIKYEPCKSIRPGETIEITGVPSELLLLKTQLADLGQEPTLRFNLTLFCRQPNGKVLGTNVTLDPFRLRLPEADQ